MYDDLGRYLEMFSADEVGRVRGLHVSDCGIENMPRLNSISDEAMVSCDGVVRPDERLSVSQVGEVASAGAIDE